MTTIGPGTRVRCIDDVWHPNWRGLSGPQLGTIWTVADINQPRDFIGLVEWPDQRICFDPAKFVPIDDLGDLRELAREAKNPDAPARKRELV